MNQPLPSPTDPVPGWSIRFQVWIVSATVVLVLLLTGGFLLAALGSFQTLAQDHAHEKLDALAGQIATRLDHLLRDHRRLVQVIAAARPDVLSGHGGSAAPPLESALVAALRSSSELYSVYFAKPTGEFVQAVAVQGQPSVAQALDSPPDTDLAVRHIGGIDSRRQRVEQWQFFSAGGSLLGDRTGVAQYDPTNRSWFLEAVAANGIYQAEPYRYQSTGELGVSITSPVSGGLGVVGVDISLRAFARFLDELELSEHGVVVVLDDRRRLLAISRRGVPSSGDDVSWLLKSIDEVGEPMFTSIATALAGTAHGATRQVMIDGVNHALTQKAVELGRGRNFHVVSVAPEKDFTAAVTRARRDVLWAAFALLLILVPLVYLSTRQVATALRSLARNSERIRRLDFSQPSEPVRSFLSEVNTLGSAQLVMHASLQEHMQALELAKRKLAQIVDTGIRLGREHDRQVLLRHVLFGARDIAHAQAATLFIRTERNTLRFALRTSDDPLPTNEIPLYDAVSGAPIHQYVSTHVALTAQSVVIDDVYQETRFDLSGTRKFSEESGIRAVSMLTVPLYPREGDVIGILQLINCLDDATGEVIAFDPETVGFIEALAAQSAVAIENQNLLDAQEELMDSLIRIIAGSIDAKSAYTGGHCERVPELATMLAEAATQQTQGALADFRFSTEDEWREFRIGAWLHDCGKVTTPEYVVDKATKLETIYNRIHEVRTRFEVLLRDAEIAALRAIAAGADATRTWEACAEHKRQLHEDFAFIAECNVGGEFLAPQNIARIQAIAQRTWWRHFDDRLGLSSEEARRMVQDPKAELPVLETLLSDKPSHIVPRGASKALDARHGFAVQVPEHLYNHGEVYNLSIPRGTLNQEERFKINEHIIQTIVMLEQMPFPKHLRRVPEYAGTHHETLIGTGYPRKLKGGELSVPSRIMAIADIFEALTASDRPYKKAKTLSESIDILANFKRSQHIDADLFDLFLTSGVYRRYAERFLLPEQIDEVEIERYLG